jgi:hypothetical protein
MTGRLFLPSFFDLIFNGYDLMTLRSRQFRDSKKLQLCLVSDSAHVTPGQAGDHVSRIQYALMRLLVSDLPPNEIHQQLYGPKTADAVLRYKRALNIINRSYETQADNIVGRMTIKSLDDNMGILEGGFGPIRQPRLMLFDPPSPQNPPGSRGSFAFMAVNAVVEQTGGDTSGFEPPLSVLPDDLQQAIRRSNAAKTPGDLRLFPFIRNDLGPQSDKDLSKGFADNPNELAALGHVYARMKPFDIFQTVKEIFNVFSGAASGFFCEPFNYTTLTAWMMHLTLDPKASGPLRDSPFCRDTFNVHGPRDCFREIVRSGAGLHICITQPSSRGQEHCDFHIDHSQQGQVCFDGKCVPIINGQTWEHLSQVGPWLAKEAEKKVVDWGKKLIVPSPLF